MSTEFAQLLVAVVSIILTLCFASIRHTQQKAKELADAVLLQNIEIVNLKIELAVTKAQTQISRNRS